MQESGIKLAPHFFGGEQERKRRAGTENVPAIAGFLEAVKLAQSEQISRSEQYKKYKEIFSRYFKRNDVEFQLNGSLEGSLPHVIKH